MASSSGGGNRLQLHEITAGTPDTISTTPTIVFDQTFGSDWDKPVHLGAQLTLDQEKYDTDTLTLLTNISTTAPAEDTDTEYYENGTAASAVGSSSFTGKRYVYIWYGGTDTTGAFRHVKWGVCYITQDSGAIKTAHNERTKPSIIIKGMKQKVSNNIALAAGVWSGSLVQTTTPSPALPTQITGDTYGSEQFCELP